MVTGVAGGLPALAVAVSVVEGAWVTGALAGWFFGTAVAADCDGASAALGEVEAPGVPID
jgi:hypothetical protein